MPLHHHHHRRQFDSGSGHAHQILKGRDANGDDSQVATLVSVVFVTASPTFSGPIGGFTTMIPTTAELLPATSAQVQTTQVSQPAVLPQSSAQLVSSAAADSSLLSSQASTVNPPLSTSLAQSGVPPTTASAVSQATSKSLLESIPTTSDGHSFSATTTNQNTTPTTGTVAAASATQPSSSALVTASKASSGGLSGGAKAGLAIGILLGLGLLLALLAFCYRRKKQQQPHDSYGRTEEEKNPFGDDAAPGGLVRAVSTPAPPQLSLRPESQFRPDLPGQRKSANLLGMTGTSAVVASRNKAIPPNNRDLEKAQLQADHSSNPFGSNAETPAPSFGSHVPIGQEVPAPLRVRTPTPEGKGAFEGASAATTAQRHNGPKPLDLKAPVSGFTTAMPSPAGTEFSMTSMSPEPMGNGSAPTNVHRIQLDFKPSMDDELELRAGQLVRLLHEYDDGWALCIRLDRSQQGVAPRTCLSTRPVKPRPNGNVRGVAPPSGLRGPPQQRPMSPTGRTASPSPSNGVPGPMSPNPIRGQRSMSPGPYGGGPQRTIPTPGGKRRSNSASDIRERRNSPPGPSPMNPNAQVISQGMQGVQRVPMHLQAITPPGEVPPQSPASVVSRKPVGGRSM